MNFRHRFFVLQKRKFFIFAACGRMGIKMIHLKTYDNLPEDSASIRNEVFVDEQGFEEEFDSTDNKALHILLYEDLTPAGTCRIYWNEEKKAYVLGRLAVKKQFRGKGLGALLVHEAEKQASQRNADRLLLASQLRVRQFYEKQGYEAVGEVFYEQDCPHIWMLKAPK